MADRSRLEIPLWTWVGLYRGLWRRGRGVRESGAFLLGQRGQGTATVRQIVYYDDLDPDALKTGIVRLSGSALGPLWALCTERGLEVLADVHTHPGGSGQSESDRAHPMVAIRGHISLIVPNFARNAFDLAGVGHYRFEGNKRWYDACAPRLRFLSIHFEVTR